MFVMPIGFTIIGFVLALTGIKAGDKIVAAFGIVFLLSAVFLFYQFFKERRLRKLYEQDPEAYEAMIEEEEEEDPEVAAYEREMEELEEFDADSGKGYCPHCGNYAVTENRCESCGEKVTE